MTDRQSQTDDERAVTNIDRQVRKREREQTQKRDPDTRENADTSEERTVCL